MKKSVFKSLRQAALCFSVLSCTTAVISAESEQALSQEALLRISQFAKELKGELSAAIQGEGLQAGVAVCHEKAPLIAQALSTDGWQVARTSLRPRNHNNQPDSWAREVMQDFEKRKAAGEVITTFIQTRMSEDEFSYIKAIPTEALCLSCHGSTVEASVKKQIELYYPNDKATGFLLGDIRGAFILTKRFEEQVK